MIPSDAPSESINVTVGSSASSPRFVSGLHVTPDDVIARSAERSQRVGSASSAPRSGRANASPTIVHTFTCSRSMAAHTASGSRRGVSSNTTVPPPDNVDSAMNKPVPCISGHAGNKVAACLPALIDVATSGGSLPGRAICHSDT